MDNFQYFRETSCLPANRCYSASNNNVLGQKTASSNSPVQRFLWKNRIFEALLQWDNGIVQMRNMAHSICLINLYQTTMRKKFRFFVSDYQTWKVEPLLNIFMSESALSLLFMPIGENRSKSAIEFEGVAENSFAKFP